MSEHILKLAVLGREVVFNSIYHERPFSDEEFYADYLATHEIELKAALQNLSIEQFETLARRSLSIFSVSEDAALKHAYVAATDAVNSYSEQQAYQLKKDFGRAILLGACAFSLAMILLASRVQKVDGQGATFYEGVPEEVEKVIRAAGDALSGVVSQIIDAVASQKSDDEKNDDDKSGDANDDNGED